MVKSTIWPDWKRDVVTSPNVDVIRKVVVADSTAQIGKVVAHTRNFMEALTELAISHQLPFVHDYESKVDAVKTLCSEYASKAADLGISILGGMGYSAETDMQRYWRDSRLLRIGPVSNEMARNQIAESFGLPRSY